jgi:hypothetical protein
LKEKISKLAFKPGFLTYSILKPLELNTQISQDIEMKTAIIQDFLDCEDRDILTIYIAAFGMSPYLKTHH